MSKADLRPSIQQRLLQFDSQPLGVAAMALFEALGYRSERRLGTGPMPPAAFVAAFGDDSLPDSARTMLEEAWNSIELLFQLTDAEVRSAEQLRLVFDSAQEYEAGNIQSYLFAAVDLATANPTRQQLAAMTRSINRLFSMPVLILFRHGAAISLSIIRRRVSRRNEEEDVLERVTLIKDIQYQNPLRAHIDILHDLALTVLHDEFSFRDFAGLHQAWEKRLDANLLTGRFYRDIANWYFWASNHPKLVLPRSVQSEEERSLFLIRLLTRLIFCWFLQEKGLMPRDLFRSRVAQQLLKDTSPGSGGYYRAVLQNLFFATLNQEPGERGFRSEDRFQGVANDYGVTNRYRYAALLADADLLMGLLHQVPFVNGGLFECLDRATIKPEVRYDDFSENKLNPLRVPYELFFGDEREVDLSEIYDDQRRRRERVRGLFEILGRYKFTVEENTPLEQEIALDPELLGHVFENLSAAYNEDTRTTARKATGSFYTPREIVSYMVDEALLVYLRNHLAAHVRGGAAGAMEERLRTLFDSSLPSPAVFGEEETRALIDAIDHVKILDPACGSGAFPMGALQRLVALLQKLDPDNERWREVQRRRALAETEQAYRIGERGERRERLDEIEAVFTHNTSDYGRKLYLIENCLYGVDIQPIACQIAKLRFFIALIVDQKVEPAAANYGVRPLPNLETRIVAADTLNSVSLPGGAQISLLDATLQPLRQQLEEVRHEYFTARNTRKKRRCRERDEALRQEIAGILQGQELPAETAQLLASWDPYDQNTHAGFFDPAWMFGVPVGKAPLGADAPATLRGSFAFINETAGQMQLAAAPEVESGFDIVIGNPPYVRQEQIKGRKAQLSRQYATYSGTADLYVYFYERAVRLLKPGGVLSFITSNKWYRSAYGEKLRTWLTANLRLLRLVDFGDAPIFTAIAYPTIVIGERVPSGVQVGEHTVQALTWQLGRKIEEFRDIALEESFPLAQNVLAADGWKLERNSKLRLFEQIQKTGTPLGKFCGGRLYYGIKTGLNEAFIVTKDVRDSLIAQDPSSAEILKPYLRGRDVKRWRVEPQDLWLIFTPWHFPLHEDPTIRSVSSKAESAFNEKYPAVYQHLQQFSERLAARDRAETGIRYEWYALQRYREYWPEFELPKIVMPAISDSVNFAPDYQGYFSNDKTNICIPPSIPYTLAILNSPVTWWYSQQTFASKQGGFYEFKPMYVSQLPIPAANPDQQQLVEILADYVTWLYSPEARQVDAKPNALTVGYLEQVINGLVYELFFGEELAALKLTLFRHLAEAKLRPLHDVPAHERASYIGEVFERLYHSDHPVRGILFSLQSVKTVRMIEGKAE